MKSLVTKSLIILIVSGVLTGCDSANIQLKGEQITVTAVRVDRLSSPNPSQEAASALATADCQRDSESLVVNAGWELLWQRTFEHPIARPPLINGPQLLILEREDPSRIEFKDKIFMLDPQTSSIQWSYTGISGIQAHTLRQVKDFQWTQKYVALNILFTDTSSTSPATTYTVVLDRATGQVVYSEALNSSETLLSDDALYYRGAAFQELHRLDFPNQQQRWAHQSGGKGFRGLFLVNYQLYAFHSNQSVYQYDPLDGTAVATTTLNAVPIEHDALVKNHDVVIRSWYPNQEIFLFDFETLQPKWVTAVSYAIRKPTNTFLSDIPSMTLTSDSIYAFDADNRLIRIDLSTGKILWTAPSPTSETEAMSRPAVVSGLVYGLYSDGTIRAFSELTGSEDGIAAYVPLWYWKSDNNKEWRDLVGGLAAANDTLIVTTGCRSVYAIQRDK